jgi:hypothetical protein
MIDATKARRAAWVTLRVAIRVVCVAAEIVRLLLPVVLAIARVLFTLALISLGLLAGLMWVALGPSPRRRRRC